MVSRLIGFGAAPSGWPALTVAGRALAGLVDPTAWHDAEPIGVKPDGEDDPLAELVGDFRGSNYAGWLVLAAVRIRA